jgi:ubiquinone/menaquinone biosynthesis C-methylase UbiE
LGLSPREDLIDTNFFEKFYPYPNQITGASVEDCRNLKLRYPGIKLITVKPDQKLPFANSQFDLAVSWATLEHVGSYQQQQDFLNELLRVGKRIFVTTPYRSCFYEPHTGTFFLHWLPLSWFRKWLKRHKKLFWSEEKNWNPLNIQDIKNMKLNRAVQVQIYHTLGFIPSHLLISA